MGNIPVLKPREVSRILENLGFVEVRSAVHTNNFVMSMAVARLSPFIRETSPRFCCGKLQRTLEWMSWISSATDSRAA
jgi:hypothetical protein